MKSRNLSVWVFLFFGFSVLAFPQMQEVEWGKVKGTASVIILNTPFDEVWNRVQDILLFEKFKPRGSVYKVKHQPVTIEKDSGLLVVGGYMGGSFFGEDLIYTLKISIQTKDGHLVVKAQCNSSWKKRVVEKFFQLLKESEEEK